MPRHPDFEKIYQNFIKRYGKEKGEQIYYAWLNARGYDDTKPLKSQVKACKESFSWIEPFSYYSPSQDRLLIKGVALNVGETQNHNLYIQDELERAARTLIGKPLNLNHEEPIEGDNKVLDAEFEDNRIEYVAQVTNRRVIDLIRDGTIKHVSIEAQFRRGYVECPDDYACFFYPEGLVFTGFALLTNDVLPGDPGTSVEILECLKLTPRIGVVKNQKEGEKGKMPEEKKEPSTVEVASTKPAIPPEAIAAKEVEEKEWDTAYINDLPDDAFAYIEPGGKKDEQGKTVPRSLRHLPYKNHKGEIDLPHLRNALARLDQTNLSPEAKKQALKVLCKAAKQVGIKSEKCAEELGESKAEAESSKEEKPCLPCEEKKKALQAQASLESQSSQASSSTVSSTVEEKENKNQKEVIEKMSKEIKEKGLIIEEEKLEDPKAKLMEKRKGILERLRSGSLREQWETPIALAVAPQAHLRDFVITSEIISGKAGDVVTIPYVKDFDMDVLASVGASLTERTGLIGTVTTTLKEAGTYTQLAYADVEKINEDVLGKLEENFAYAALRAEDKAILNMLLADANVPELDKSTETVDFKADWIAEALGKLMIQGKDVKSSECVLVIDAKMHDALLRNIASSQPLAFARPDIIQQGVIKQFLGVNILISHYLPEHDTTNHKRSAYLIHKNAIVFAPKRELLVETQRDIVARKIKITGTHTFGIAILDNKAVVEIKTPATTPS